MSDYIINLLNKAGLTDAEGKVYLALLKNGSCSGYEASKLAGVPRSKIYNILESLATKGFALFTDGESGHHYAAVPVKEVSERIRHETEENLRDLDEELAGYEAKTDLDYIWHIREYKNVFAKCREIIRRTEEELLIQVWEEDLPQIEKDLKELEKKDVRMGLVFFGEEEKKLPFRQYCRHGMLEDKKKEMGGRFITLVSDNKEVVFGQIVEEHTAEVIWSQSKPMIAMAAECVRHDMYFYRSAGILKEEMQEKLGSDFHGVRDIFEEREDDREQ